MRDSCVPSAFTRNDIGSHRNNTMEDTQKEEEAEETHRNKHGQRDSEKWNTVFLAILSSRMCVGETVTCGKYATDN